MKSKSQIALWAVVLLLGLAPLAMATNNPPPAPEPAKPVANASANAAADAKAISNSAAKSASVSAAKSSAEQAQKQTQVQDQSQQQSASSQSNNANDSSASLTAEYRERLQAPSISAPPVYASGSCAYGWSVGISVPGGGASGGKSRPDPACDRRELVRVITPLNPWLALKVACEDPLIVEMRLRNLATREDCQYLPPAVPTPPPGAKMPDVPAEAQVTREELRQTVDRAFKQTTKK